MTQLRLLSLFLLISVFVLPVASPLAGSRSENDLRLSEVISRLRLKPLPPAREEGRPLLRLGARLFHDPILSGNRDIACISCHHPRFAAGDALPFSIGTGGEGLGSGRKQKGARITSRSAPAVFNVHVSDELPMFWDGRVSYFKAAKTFSTPEPGIKKGHPFVEVLDSSLAAQALFPVVNHDEMRGQKGENEIADAKDNFEAWARLMKRLGADAEYRKMFLEAYPETQAWEEFNFAHATKAIAAFERWRFQAVETPFDKYLGGDLTAMSEPQKRGALLFYGSKGRCFTCHVGSTIGGTAFFSVGVAQVGNSDSVSKDDLGAFSVSVPPGDEGFRYSFKAPMLRNVALTAPYMHNGSIPTLKEVIEHYVQPEQKLLEYSHDPERYKANYSEPIVHAADPIRVAQRRDRINGVIAGGLPLDEQDQSDLLEFLENGLTDPRWRF